MRETVCLYDNLFSLHSFCCVFLCSSGNFGERLVTVKQTEEEPLQANAFLAGLARAN